MIAQRCEIIIGFVFVLFLQIVTVEHIFAKGRLGQIERIEDFVFRCQVKRCDPVVIAPFRLALNFTRCVNIIVGAGPIGPVGHGPTFPFNRLVFNWHLGGVFGFKRLIDFEKQFFCCILVGNLFPVNDTVNEVDRVIIARERKQNAAIHDCDAALINEFGFKPDRSLIGEDLQIVIRNAAEQRTARNI